MGYLGEISVLSGLAVGLGLGFTRLIFFMYILFLEDDLVL